MIKFVIGLIALIFVALAAYVYTAKKGEEITKSAVTHDVVKKEVTEEKVVSVTKEVSTPSKPVVEKSVEKEGLLVRETSNNEVQTTNSENEIGKGLTLESIENADVSDEEKLRMRMDMVYYQSLHSKNTYKSKTKEEITEMLKKDLENGL